MRDLHRRVWETLHEPRTRSALAVVAYVAAAVAGVFLLAVTPPPPLAPYEPLLRSAAGVALLLAGLAGAPTAWLGKHYVERGAAFIALGGVVVSGLEVALIHTQGRELSLPVLTFAGLAWSALFWMYRLTIVCVAPYAPGRGPQLPEYQELPTPPGE